MRKQLVALAALSALALPATAQAAVTITPGTTVPIPANNDFGPGSVGNELGALGLVSYATTGSSIVLDAAHTISFWFLGSESGYDDTFSAPGGINYTETSTGSENHFGAPIFLGSSAFAAGSLAGLLNFTTSSGLPGGPATVGQAGFAIYLPDGASGPMVLNDGDTFYFGYDDQVEGPDDDNHDDFIIRATIGAVPEPSTWALMILGFGAIGFGMRQRKQSERIRFDFA